jgi:hypothetical protein
MRTYTTVTAPTQFVEGSSNRRGPDEQQLAFHRLVWMTLLSQEPAHRECVEDSKGKRPVGLRRIVGKRADDAVKHLHYCHDDSQKRDCHAGTNADRDQDRQQQSDASRSRIPGEAVVPAWAE